MDRSEIISRLNQKADLYQVHDLNRSITKQEQESKNSIDNLII